MILFSPFHSKMTEKWDNFYYCGSTCKECDFEMYETDGGCCGEHGMSTHFHCIKEGCDITDHFHYHCAECDWAADYPHEHCKECKYVGRVYQSYDGEKCGHRHCDHFDWVGEGYHKHCTISTIEECDRTDEHRHCTKEGCKWTGGIPYPENKKYHKHCEKDGCERTFRHMHCEKCGWTNEPGPYQHHNCNSLKDTITDTIKDTIKSYISF